MKTQTIWTIVIIALVVIAGAAYFMMKAPPASAPVAPPAQIGPQAAKITIANMAFAPAALTIKVGDTVTWTNTDSTKHLVASSGVGGIASPSLSTGQSYSKTFSTAGTYAYHCEIHPAMKGTIVVQ